MKKNTVYTIAICVCALLVSGCARNERKEAALVLPDAVKIACPLVENVEIWKSYSARIEPSESVEIRARVGGYLDRVNFKKGRNVAKGELLFSIDPRPYKIAASAAAAAVKAAESKIALAEDNFRRAQGLYERKAISEEMYQTRKTELLIARARLLEAQANDENARLNLEYTSVTAPISGKVTENYVDCGNLVAANASVLARIVRQDSVKVYFELSQRDALRYKTSGFLKNIESGNGASVKIVQKNEDAVYTGRLTYFDNRLNHATSSLAICADIPNPDGSLLAGSFADIQVKEGEISNALLLPEQVIGTDLTGRYVLTLDKENVVKYTPVKVGELLGKMRVIESGITAGTQVVVVGLQRAKAGRKVTVSQIELKRD